MPRSAKQMRAIIMALKKKGLLQWLSKKTPKNLGLKFNAPTQFHRSSFAVQGKGVALLVDRKLKSSAARFYTSEKAGEALSKIPAPHFRQMGIKGIYIMDDASFRRMLTQSSARSLPHEEARSVLATLEGRVLFGEVPAGIHHRGRIFINGRTVDGAVKRALDFEIDWAKNHEHKPLSPSAVAKMRAEFTHRDFSALLAHESAHNFDNPRGGFGLRGSWKSGSPAYLKALGVKTSWERLDTKKRVEVIEGFASGYTSYLEDPEIFQRTDPKRYKAIKLFFEETS